MVYCPNCGTVNNDDAKFCNECGGEIRYDGKSKPKGEIPGASAKTTSTGPSSYEYREPPRRQYYGSRPMQPDEASAPYYCCSFCFPIVGVVLWLVWKDERPNTANTMLMLAIIGFFLDLIFGVASNA